MRHSMCARSVSIDLDVFLGSEWMNKQRTDWITVRCLSAVCPVADGSGPIRFGRSSRGLVTRFLLPNATAWHSYVSRRLKHDVDLTYVSAETTRDLRQRYSDPKSFSPLAPQSTVPFNESVSAVHKTNCKEVRATYISRFKSWKSSSGTKKSRKFPLFCSIFVIKCSTIYQWTTVRLKNGSGN